MTKALQRAALWVALGLGVQALCFAFWTPLTFVLFACVGIPLVGVGVVVYLRALLRFLGEKKAL